MNVKELELEQIYHPYNVWEDYKNGFYDNVSGKNKIEMIEKVIKFFSDPLQVEEVMFRVVDEWFYSCEHNLTNNGMNKIAYIGQASLSYLHKIPSTITMEAWSKVPKEFQIEANNIAERAYDRWLVNYERIILMRSQDNKC
jgi:hypothetical protein